MPDNSQYKELLRHEIDLTSEHTAARKRRRKAVVPAAASAATGAPASAIHNDVEVVVIDDSGSDTPPNMPQSSESVLSDDSDSDSDDDFEDVEINPLLVAPINALGPSAEDDTITVTLGPTQNPEADARHKKGRKANVISKEERANRVLQHQGYILTMAFHGYIRNHWCSDPVIMAELRRRVPKEVHGLLHSSAKDLLDVVKSRRFLDGLKRLMEMWGRVFRRTSTGLIRKTWSELKLQRKRSDGEISLGRFRKLCISARGSRDIGAQAFVALLRSAGVKARLVFSLQAPDFTSIVSEPEPAKATVPDGAKSKISSPTNKLFSQLGVAGVGRLSSRNNFLGEIRKAPVKQDTTVPEVFVDSPFPIFWVEAWNMHSKKWVSIDPISLKILENAPMRRKSSFEPPMTDIRNQLIYVLAYDTWGKVKDVTRRYSQSYNAKTCKKRISYRMDDQWYENVLRAINGFGSNNSKRVDKMDALEMKEFYDRDLAEGMPNSVADFKNHPLYAMELQLRQNEVIHPKDKTTQCGTFRNKTKSKDRTQEVVIPIYKRSAVHSLRSARAWYMRGRVLKMGVNPLKTKSKSNPNSKLRDSDDSDDDEDDTIRLYADFQTQLYIPPPVKDGKIPKNAYGNIDIYTPSMIPENGFLLRANETRTIKILERAAKYILNIDHARAVVGFDFGGNNKGKNRRKVPTTKEGGILVDAEYKEALVAIVDNLIEQEEQEKKDFIERNALKNWKFFLTKLRISRRLENEHGKIEQVKAKKKSKSKFKGDSNDDFDDNEDDDSDAYSVHSEDESPAEYSGGFAPEDYQDGGGFIPKQESNTLNLKNQKTSSYGNESNDSEYEESGEYKYVPKQRKSRVGRLLEEEETYEGYDEESIPGGFGVEEEDKEDDEGEDIRCGFIIEDNGHNRNEVQSWGGGFEIGNDEGTEPLGGGFIVEDIDNRDDEDTGPAENLGGGFIIEDDEMEISGGGFLMEGDLEEIEQDNNDRVDEEIIQHERENWQENQEDFEAEDKTNLEAKGDEEFLESIPDSFFKEDENGQLVYNPDGIVEYTSQERSNFATVPKEKDVALVKNGGGGGFGTKQQPSHGRQGANLDTPLGSGGPKTALNQGNDMCINEVGLKHEDVLLNVDEVEEEEEDGEDREEEEEATDKEAHEVEDDVEDNEKVVIGDDTGVDEFGFEYESD